MVSRACSQIRSSNALATILRAVLAVGNVLNYGTARGNAQAIKLEFLLKLHEFKVEHCPCLTLLGSGPILDPKLKLSRA